MRAQFTKTEDGKYIAEFIATEPCSLSVSRSKPGYIEVYVKSISANFFQPVFTKHQVIPEDFIKVLSWAVFPVTWKVVSETPVNNANYDYNA